MAKAKARKLALASSAGAQPGWQRTAASLGASRGVFLPVSAMLLVPCFWHSRIQAGDLGSHVYNAWLVQLIAQGKAPGLTVVPQATNILFDLMLSGLNGLFGMAAAQRIAVTVAVLTFTWGAFAFVSAVAGRRAWSVFPVLAMLAYGWVFHIGFFNFYLSLGLCFWAMALTWRWERRRAPAALAILALAFVAHALPVMWAVALTAYRWVAERTPPERRPLLAAGGLAAMIVARMALNLAMEMRVQPAQLRLVSGADQLLVYDSKYGWLTLALLAFWGLRLVDVARGSGRELLAGAPFQFCLLTAAAIAIFPSWILVPGYKHALAFIADRLSLPMAVCVCALVSGPPGAARFRTWQVAAVTVVALVFFGMLYRDEGVLNGFEDRLETLVAELPPGQRVVNTVNDPVLRSGPVGHMIDRVCVGRCYSYANYEPTTAQFRVRAAEPNSLVVPTYQESYAIEIGKYVVKDRDLPVYLVVLDSDGRLALRGAEAGVAVGTISVDLL